MKAGDLVRYREGLLSTAPIGLVLKLNGTSAEINRGNHGYVYVYWRYNNGKSWHAVNTLDKVIYQ